MQPGLPLELGYGELKTHLELRPVYHRLEHRIRAHVLLCWLALLLTRIVETKTGRTWSAVREDLSDLHAGVFTGPAGAFTQTSTPTTAVRDVLAVLGIGPPKKILQLIPGHRLTEARPRPGNGADQPPDQRFRTSTRRFTSPDGRAAAEPKSRPC